MPINFYLRTAKVYNNDTLLPIWVEVRKGSSFRFRSPIEADCRSGWWDEKNNCLRKGLLLNDENGRKYKEIDERMEKLRERFNVEVIDNPEHQNNDYCKNIVYSVMQGKAEQTIPTDIYGFAEWIVNDMTDGREIAKGHNAGEEYRNNTKKSWSASLGIIRGVLNYYYNLRGEELTWNGIDESTPKMMKDYMTEQGYAVTTIDKQIKTFRALCNMAFEKGINNNTASIKVFHRMQIKKEDMAVKVVLSQAEYDALLAMPLEGERKLFRDLFCFGTAICQRVSDYSTIRKEQYEWVNGILILRVEQQKTDAVVYLPILDERIIKILGEYDYQLPAVSSEVLNRGIKDICHELAESVPSLNEEVTTHLTMKERNAEQKAISKGKPSPYGTDENGNRTKKKWQCVVTHTARRTGATLLKRGGKLTDEQICKFTGHTTVGMLYTYLQMNEEDKRNDALKLAQLLMK